MVLVSLSRFTKAALVVFCVCVCITKNKRVVRNDAFRNSPENWISPLRSIMSKVLTKLNRQLAAVVTCFYLCPKRIFKPSPHIHTCLLLFHMYMFRHIYKFPLKQRFYTKFTTLIRQLRMRY